MSLLKAQRLSSLQGRQDAMLVLPTAVRTAKLPARHAGALSRSARLTPGPSRRSVRASAGDGQQKVEFGYSRKDVVIIGAGLIGLGYALYYGLQAAGMEPGMAGNWVQLIIFMGICVGWVGSYVYRVSTKQMTYVKQLENYETAVMQKRLEEMTEAEMQQLMSELDKDQDKVKDKQAGAASKPAE